MDVVGEYLRWHDCGKPLCRVDTDGKMSFPNHAAVSKQAFLNAGGDCGVASLIGLDMVFHSTKPADICRTAAGLEVGVVATLVLTAWAAVFANADMFGGIGSEGFKIKVSQLTARCKKVLPWIASRMVR